MTSNLHSSGIDTPIGPLTMITDSDGSVRAAGFTSDTDALLALIHPALRGPVRTRPDLGAATVAVRHYLDGDLGTIDEIPVEQHAGGTFLPHAWRILRGVKAGEPVTYTGYAELAGRPAAVRAAASACARNAVALLVPCHRVIRTDGGLGGYRWGLDVKKWLLGHERR